MGKTKKQKTTMKIMNKRDNLIKILKLTLLISLLVLIVIYFLLRVRYSQGAFTVSLDPDFAKKSGIIIYENSQTKESRRILSAEKKDFMDNISINWLPKNINDEADGAHNGENYLAYTFYVENQGNREIDYWYTILIDDVIKDIDTAIRVMIYQNDERIVYAKQRANGEPEVGTEKFYSEDCVLIKQRQNFKEGDVDKFTIVVFLEGDDYDCVDALIGGEMKMHLEILEEHKDQ